jgi:hypothetical protein
VEDFKDDPGATPRVSRGLVGAAMAGAAAVAGTVWLYAWTSPDDGVAARPAAAVAAAVRPSAPARAVDKAPAAPPSAASAIAKAASVFAVPPVESAAESLRKVQLGLSGGSAQDALVAAITLESCVHADEAANSLVQGRSPQGELPAPVKKLMDSLGPISDAQIARAQADQRRCQAFDAATLARRGELYQKAYDGGAQGAAISYLTWLTHGAAKDQADPDTIDRVRAAVRADALAADLGTLANFVYGGRYTADAAGAGPEQVQAYREAYYRIIDEGMPGQSSAARTLVANLAALGPPEPALSARQQHDAETLARRIVDAWHRARRPPATTVFVASPGG